MNTRFTVHYVAECTIQATIRVLSIELCAVIFSQNLQEASFLNGIPLKTLQTAAKDFAIKAVSKKTGVSAAYLYVSDTSSQAVYVEVYKGAKFDYP